MNSVGLYIHFPFCKKKCLYCDFYSGEDLSLIDEYVGSLIGHIENSSEALPVDTIFFGGGTPSLMSVKQLTGIIDAAKRSFRVSDGCEITVEVNPCTNEKEKLTGYRKAGVNRISIGAQSMTGSELASLGRLHGREDIINTVRDTKNAGIDNISLDFMYGIPNQTEASLENSLNEAISFGVKHISLYGLTIEKNTPFSKVKRESLALPDEETEAQMYFNACRILSDAGFVHYEISNFAKAGYACRHNLKYWRAQEYLGFGPGAHSYFKGVRYSYEKNIAKYIQNPVPSECETIDEREKEAEYIMLSLRLREGIEYKRLKNEPCESLLNYVDRLSRHGLADKRDGGFALREKGFYLSNKIIADIEDFI